MPTEFSGTRDEKYAATATGVSYVPGWVRRTVVGGLNKNARMHIWGHSTSNAHLGTQHLERPQPVGGVVLIPGIFMAALR
jgi:hypothetical protein